MPTDIVMVTWYRPEITRLVIETLHANTKPGSFRLIVIDNFSPPAMMNDLLQMYSDGLIDELVLNNSNRGLEPARNQGLELVKSDLFVCLDNDCLIMKPVDGEDWLEMMIGLMDRHPDYAAVSARTQVMIGTGNIFEETDENGQELTDFPHPGGSFRIMRTDLVRGVGGWRDEVSGRGTEERYISGQLRELGYKTAFATHIKCLHLFGDRTRETDRWGYPRDWTPSATGHSDIWHPVLERGDDPDEMREYTDVLEAED